MLRIFCSAVRDFFRDLWRICFSDEYFVEQCDTPPVAPEPAPELPEPVRYYIELASRRISTEQFFGDNWYRVPDELVINAFASGTQLPKHDMRSPLARFVIAKQRELKKQQKKGNR